VSRPIAALVGARFGRLVVLRLAETRKTPRKPEWVCACDCGGTKQASTGSLRGGQVRSCGCLRSEHWSGVLQRARAVRASKVAARRKDVAAAPVRHASPPGGEEAAKAKWHDAADALADLARAWGLAL
jgi:hypothetical protein